jgi:hypothetical protein
MHKTLFVCMTRLRINTYPPSLYRDFTTYARRETGLCTRIDKDIVVHVKDVVDSLLFMFQTMFPMERWASARQWLLETGPESALARGLMEDPAGFAVNVVSYELDLLLTFLTPAQVKQYFNV